MLICVLIVIGSVLLDQLTKLWAFRALAPNGSFELIKGVFRFTYIENDGAAFGMLDDHRWIFMLLSTVGIAALAVYLWRFAPKSMLAKLSISFIIGGGIGNMIDRIRLGFVIDFLDFCAFPNLWKWVFNVADSFVCVGTGMLIVYLIIDIIKDAKAEKNKASEADGGEKAENE